LGASSDPGCAVTSSLATATGHTIPRQSCFTVEKNVKRTAAMPELSDFDRGLLVGLLVGEGSFGGDGKQPQITLRMHVRHEAVFRWLEERFPGCRLYGPYHHGGRSYYQWMARGTALVRDLLPVLEGVLDDLDAHAAQRFQEMCASYSGYIERERARLAIPDGDDQE
jgi:hypothetical protein